MRRARMSVIPIALPPRIARQLLIPVRESVSEKPGFGECKRTCATRGDRSRPDCAGARRNVRHFIPRGRGLYHIGIFSESGRRFGRGLVAPAAWVSGSVILKEIAGRIRLSPVAI